MPPKKNSKSAAAVDNSSTVFAGDTFCVSGALSISQNAMKQLIIQGGGTIASTPNKNCTYLVADSMGSAKAVKAAKDGITIVTEAWVQESIDKEKKSTKAAHFLSGGGAASTKAKGKGKGKGKAASVDEDDDDGEEEVDDEMEEDEPAPPKKGKKAAKPAAVAKKAKAATKKKKGKKEVEEEEVEEEDQPMEEEEEEEEKPAAKGKGKASAKAKKGKKVTGKRKAEEPDEEAAAEEPSTKKVKKEAASKKKTASKKKGKKGKKAADEEDEDEPMEEEEVEEDEEDDDKPAVAASASSSSGGGRKADREVPGRDGYTIVDEYACLLNQTNITGGQNNNKFYVIQLLKNSSGEHFVWTRWGRVGEPGQKKLTPFGDDFSGAVKAFESKFKDKTKNTWDHRSNFVKYTGKYDLVETEEGGEGEGDGDAPLGRLSKTQIEKGQAILAQLRQVIESGGKKGDIGELSAKYYTCIPTVVGRQAAKALSDLNSVQEKEELLKFMLRMGFDEVDTADAGLSPIDGIIDLPLPSSLMEAAKNVTSEYEIKNSDARGETLAAARAGNPKKSMTPHMYAAIMLYTSNAIYAALNQALREEKRHKVKQYFRYLRLLLEAMSTLSGETTTLWRGLSVDVSAQYAVGSTMTWWGVSSCTSDQNVARNFMNSCGGKTTLLTIKAKTACDISSITFFPHEKESLLAPGTQVKVLSNKTTGNVTEITVEEVGQAFSRE